MSAFITKSLDLDDSRSASDKKHYRLLTLSNGLKVLLVSTKDMLPVEEQKDASKMKAAAAMAVQVGSYSDPQYAEGCAHYLEHMVFMGSEKYPAENHYDSFVTANGGSCNAFTEGEYTVYSFDVLSSAFTEALDIFAQCIIAPTLNASALDREVEAIESEFRIAQMEDESRLQQLVSHQMKDEHVLHKFSWGNKQSLAEVPKAKGVNMRDTMRKFHAEHYSPRNMSLTVSSPHSLEELETAVLASFAAWSKDGKAGEEMALYAATNGSNAFDAFAKEELQQLTRVIPIKKNHKVSLLWVIPPGIKEYDKKSSEYISHLMGHEGPGSLLSYLRKENLANAMSVGVSGSNFDENSFLSLFNVTIKLTKKGFVQWTKVVRLVFEYMSMLRAVGPQAWVFEEIKSMHDIEYRFMDEEESYDFVERLVVQMLPCLGRKDEDLLTAASLVKSFVPSEVNTLLDSYLTPRRAKIHFISSQFQPEDEDDDGEEEDDDDDEMSGDDEDDDEEDEDDSEDEEGKGGDDEVEGDEAAAGEDRITAEEMDALYEGPLEWKALLQIPSYEASSEPHFGLRYYQDALPASLYAFWEAACDSAAAIHSELHLPPRNHFIPRNVDMIDHAQEKGRQHKRPCIEGSNKCDKTDNPRLHRFGPHSLWHVVETKFGRPKVEIHIQLYCKLFYEGLSNVVAHDLLIKLLKEQVNEVVYMASMAELSCSFKIDYTAWRIHVSGFSDKAIFFAKLLLANLCSSQFITSDAERIKRQLQVQQEQYENEILKSDQIANHNRLAILFPAKIPTKDKLAFLKQEKDQLSSADWLLQLHSDFCQHFQITTLVEGNVDIDEARDLMSFSTELLREAPTNATMVDVEQSLLSQTSSLIPLLACPSTDDETLWSSKKPNLLHMSDRNLIVLHDIPNSPHELNSCAEIYFQYGLYNVVDVTKLDLLESLLTEPFFDQMRTKQQMGYSVSCGMRQSYGIMGFCFKILSSSHSLEEVTHAILNFAFNAHQFVESCTKQHIEKNIESLAQSKLQPDLSLGDTAGYNWGQIEEEIFCFQTREEQAEVVRNPEVFNQKTMVQFAKELFNEKCRIIVSLASVNPKDQVSTMKSIKKVLKKIFKKMPTIMEITHPSEVKGKF